MEKKLSEFTDEEKIKAFNILAELRDTIDNWLNPKKHQEFAKGGIIHDKGETIIHKQDYQDYLEFIGKPKKQDYTLTAKQIQELIIFFTDQDIPAVRIKQYFNGKRSRISCKGQ